MMQLLCNGKPLDLYEDADLQFTQENPLFAFDNIKCERTTSFKIPATPTNDALLSLARVPATRGEGMRRKFDAIMQFGVIQKTGYLYVSEYDGKEYNAIFVTGELVGLQRVRDAGSVNEILQYNAALTWGQNVKAANASSLDTFDNVRHEIANGGIQSPSFNVQAIIQDACNALQIPISWNNATGADKLRLIVANSAKIDATPVRLAMTKTGSAADHDVVLTSQTFLGIVNLQLFTAAYWQAVGHKQGPEEWYDNVTIVDTADTYQISIPYDCSLKFPNDFPDDCYLVSGRIANAIQIGTGNMVWHPSTFLGGYSFWEGDLSGVTGGKPLKGRSVSIPANTPFMIVKKSEFERPESIDYEGQIVHLGMNTQNVTSYDYGVQITIEHEFTTGDLTPYNAMLPEFSLVKLLQIVATCTGTLLTYDEGLRFVPLNFNNMPKIEINAISELKEIKRVFSNYARMNYIKFKDDEGVYGFEKRAITYALDNDNLEAEKTLQTLEASEGGSHVYYSGENNNIVEYDAIIVRGDKSRFLISQTNTGYGYLLRVGANANAGIRQLCDVSTQIKIEARMGYLQYQQITPETVLLVLGQHYVWTSQNWQKETASFTLAKI